MTSAATPQEQNPPHLAEVSASGLNQWGGYIDEEFHKDLRGPKAAVVYREMLDNHPLIHVGMTVIDLFARRVPFRVEPSGDTPEHAKAAELIETAMDDLPSGIGGVMSQMITALPYGWAWLEKVFKISGGQSDSKVFRSKYNDGAMRWRKIRICAQASLDHWDLDDNGEAIGMWQRAAPDFKLRYIPRSKSLHVRMFARNDNPEGFSILRGAYVSYHFQKNLQWIEAVGISRNTAGFPLVEVPPAIAAAAAGTPEKVIYDKYVTLGKKVTVDEYSCVVMPSRLGSDGMPTGYGFSLISSSGRNIADTDTPIRRYRTEIAIVMLMQFLLLGEKAGSYALGETQFEMMALIIEAVLDVGLDSLNDDAVPELCELNGIDRKFAPTIERGKIAPADLAKLGAYIQSVIGSGAVTPDGPLEDHLREEANWPEADTESARAPEMVVPDVNSGFGI